MAGCEFSPKDQEMCSLGCTAAAPTNEDFYKCFCQLQSLIKERLDIF